MSTAAPTNIFYLIDDYAGTSGLGSGQPITPDFLATSVAAATQIGYLIATALQMSVRLVNKFNNGASTGFASTLIGPGPANTALTVVPSGAGVAGG
jgi:hypothetical protein